MASKQSDRYAQVKSEDIERLMETAGRLFAKYGFDGVGIRQIAKESGVKMPSIFYHFGSKAELYDEVLDYKYKATLDTITAATNAVGDPVEKLECLIGSFFDLLAGDRTFLLIVQRDIVDIVAHNARASFLEDYNNTFLVFCKLLESALERAIDINVAFSLVSLIHGYGELTAVVSEQEPSERKKRQWCIAQRAELLNAGKKLLDVNLQPL